ncbi:hypothetical protein [Fibrivirga algicola]|jgi:hypothetical protein|uniref:Ribbon-helix-helix protein, CopG family n=1 Tax=Fibrivirga algicola TaxID=2950420 RepID=A0ABX0QQV2_9BACT|nr:hypothetical protein [Fibrivirga algicola]NID13671.1 hypothetical protein [Fibrivirga algicola]
MAESLKERQARLADKLKNEPHKAPIQEVNPVAQPDPKSATNPNAATIDDLVQLNTKVPKALHKAIRRISVEEDIEIRDIVRDALETYVKGRA